MRHRLGWSLIAFGFLVLPPRTVKAQTLVAGSLRASPSQLASAARLRVDNLGPTVTGMNLTADPYQHGSRKEGMALMIVGAAGIVTGLIVDEPLITILGAGAGGVGLYLYLR